MQDRLEEFIKENRAEFDTAEPQHAVWERIDVALGEKKIKALNSQMWLWKAAVIVLIGAVGFLMIDRFGGNTPSMNEMSAVEEFKELETFYSSLISEKKTEIDNEISDNELFTFLTTDIEEIDAIYAELKNTFDEEHETPVIVDALVHLLRQKLHLLSSQLDAINRSKLQNKGVQPSDSEATSL